MKSSSSPSSRQQHVSRSLNTIIPWEGAQWPPRRWQAEALPLAIESIQSKKRQVIQAVMGAGKSALIAEIVRTLQPTSEQPIVVSCPTRALVQQLAERIQTRNPHLDVGTYYTSSKKIRPITVVCVPSLLSFASKLKGKPQAWVIDECHGSQANTALAAAQALEPDAILGVTATPFRSDDKERLTLFDEDGLIYSYTAGDALNDGVVVPWVVRKWHGINIASNDDEEDDNEAATPLDDACVSMISAVLEDGVGCGVVDADSIADAEQFASRLRTRDISAFAVHCRLKPREVAERIEWLRTGEIDVLVHVAMLKEGVDLPWLRWLCLRRKVGSKVWFAQHVGRVLRSYEGKEHAVILDPSCLFERFQLDYEAVLGGICAEAEPMMEEEEKESTGRQRQPREAVQVTMMEEWLRRIFNVLRAQSLVEKFGYNSSWRNHSITIKQISGLEKVAHYSRFKKAVKRLDPMIADVLRMAYRHRNYLSKGGGADLLSVMFNLHKAKWTQAAIRMVLA